MGAASKPAGFWVPELPCPECGHRRILGYRMDNEDGKAMHAHYVCTFWGSGKPRACGWHGWSVPGWDAAPVTDAPEPDAVTDAEHAKSVEKIASALDVDPAELTGPSPDGLPDHWADAAEQMRADAELVRAARAERLRELPIKAKRGRIQY